MYIKFLDYHYNSGDKDIFISTNFVGDKLSTHKIASYPGLPMFSNAHEKNREDLVDLICRNGGRYVTITHHQIDQAFLHMHLKTWEGLGTRLHTRYSNGLRTCRMTILLWCVLLHEFGQWFTLVHGCFCPRHHIWFTQATTVCN